MTYRYMRMIIMYDLPFESKCNIKDYNNFRNNLIKEGFIMLQFSIYSRICVNEESLNYLLKRIEKIIPKYGNIRVLNLTEKQYQKMVIIRGKKSDNEIVNDSRRLIEI